MVIKERKALQEPTSVQAQSVADKYESLGYRVVKDYKNMLEKKVKEAFPDLLSRLNDLTRRYAPQLEVAWDQLKEIVWPRESNAEEMQLKRSIVARLIYEAMSNAFHKIDTEVDNKVTLEEWVNGYDSVKHHGLDGEPFVALASVGTEERARAMFDEIAGRPDGDGDEEEKGDNKNDDNAKGERVILLERWCEFLKDAGTSV